MDNGGIENLPKDNTKDIYYACAYKKKKKSMTSSAFSKCVNDIHQKFDSNIGLIEISKSSVIIESVFFIEIVRDAVQLLNQKYTRLIKIQIQSQGNQRK